MAISHPQSAVSWSPKGGWGTAGVSRGCGRAVDCLGVGGREPLTSTRKRAAGSALF
jgi:hypothetical protein